MHRPTAGSLLALASLAVGTALPACSDSVECSGPDLSYMPELDPASFTTTIDNPLLPWPPGATWHYEGDEIVDVTVTTNTRDVNGITAVVVRDTVTEDGEIVEDTQDWYAQDADGTVWYLGEDSKELEGGEVVSTEGSWEYGVDGAQPGIVMKADPMVGDMYRQEYFACVAEDMGEVVSLDDSITVPAGSFDGCITTADTTPLEPDVKELKVYCPGVGLVAELNGSGSHRITELTEFSIP